MNDLFAKIRADGWPAEVSREATLARRAVAEARTRAGVTFFRDPPPKPRKRAGDKPPFVAFRPPPDIEEYLAALKKKEFGATLVVVRLLRTARALEEELGDELLKIEQIAEAETPLARDEDPKVADRVRARAVGRIVGRLAKEALAARKKK
jgi:hypothetical protein